MRICINQLNVLNVSPLGLSEGAQDTQGQSGTPGGPEVTV